jgi:ubiquinone/menaquinone biosynthesis C-methylase UbiE
MDEPHVDPVTLEGALDHVAAVNRWLGARRALLRHLSWALPAGRSRVLDVGTGAADLPTALAAWARAAGRPVHITAVDPHRATLDAARRRTGSTPEIRLARADGLQLPFATGAFDLALSSMTLHHMTGPALVDILTELGRAARDGRVLVCELERSLPNYLGARLLSSTVWRGNPITRHDGPLSVLRSFTAHELLELGRRAGLRNPRVHRHPFYRLVLRAEA